ncbi:MULTISPECIES: hypothetical protein [Nocardia]|uniref:hypothetical protein n=1 Tax=Nocardia TaxID=1817 RepID=UPI000D69B248|nr:MULTISPECIES: hypothetical protein [Nocardia]
MKNDHGCKVSGKVVKLGKFTDGIALWQATPQDVSNAYLNYLSGENTSDSRSTSVAVGSFNSIAALPYFFRIQQKHVLTADCRNLNQS